MKKRNEHAYGKQKKPVLRPCNLCGQVFGAKTRFSRFCTPCKAERDIYRFSDWLPHQSALESLVG